MCVNFHSDTAFKIKKRVNNKLKRVGNDGVDDGRGELNKKLLRINRSTELQPWNFVQEF